MGRVSVASSSFTGETNGNTPANFTALNPDDGSITIDTERVESNVSSQTLDARWSGSGTFIDNQYGTIQVSGLSNPGGLNQMGIILRASADTGAARDMYRVFVLEDNTTSIRVEKVVNGSPSTLKTTAVGSFQNNDTLGAEIEGDGTSSTIKYYWNGTLVDSYVDSTSPLTGGKPGITARLEFGPGLFGDVWDAGNLETTLVCAAGTYTLVGQAVELTKNLGTATNISGLVAGSSAAWIGSSYVGAKDASAGAPYTLTCDAGAYTLSGQAAGLLAARKVVADQGSYALTGQAANLVYTPLGAYNLTCEAGTYTLVGQDALVDLAITCEAGSYTLTGQAATLTYTPLGAYTLTADSGAYSLTGQAANLLVGRVLVADQGSYTLAGQVANTLFGRVLTADAGAYALSGQAAGLLVGRLLTAAAGSYALSGQDGTLTYTPAGSLTLTADAGSYSLAGQAANLLFGRSLAAAQGTYTLNGQAATLTYTPAGQYTLTAEQGAYALTGQSANLLTQRRMTADAGAYSLTGFDAALQRVITMVAAAGSYVLSGVDAALRVARRLVAEVGLYGLAGQSVTLDYAGALQALGAGARRRMRVATGGRTTMQARGGRGTQEVG